MTTQHDVPAPGDSDDRRHYHVKVRVERDVLADAVAWVARSLPTRPSAPARAGMLLDADGSRLVLAGVDADVSARAEIDADASESGRVIVSGRLLAEITRSLPDRPVQLVSDGTKVVLTCGPSRFTLLTLPGEDFLDVPEMPPAVGRLSGDVLATAVAQVAFAAGREVSGLAALTGVRLEMEADTLTLAATDRYRMAVRELAWSPEQSGVSSTALVPARTFAEVARSLSRADKVVISLAQGGEGVIGFEGDGRRTTSRLIDQTFPPYRNLLPTSFSTAAILETAPFAEAVKRVALVAERNTPIRLRFDGEEVRLEAGSGEEAQASESTPATVEGEAIEIAFNPTYLLEGLGALDMPLTRITFTVPTKPAVLVGLSEVGTEPTPEYRYLLMPVRLSG